MAERALRVTIIGDERDLLRAFSSSSRATKQFETKMAGTSRSIRNVFAAAGIGLGAAGIIRALRSTVGAALSFESSFAGVRKTVDATEPQLEALADSFRRLALEIPVSVDEINRIGEAAGQLGIQRTGILDFTKTVAALGATTNLASEQAADALARLANITQTPQDEFGNLGSVIADLGNKLAATESEIVDFGLRIAASGKIVGLTVDQTLAIAGAFSSVGVEAEAGGTAVSKVFISLANAVQTGGKQLETFASTAGVSAAEFRRAFEQDAGSAFVSFVQGLARIDKEGGNVFQTLKDLGLSDARLIRAFLSISQSGDLLNRSLAVGSRAWRENSALQTEAAKRYETTASKLQIFQNRVNDLQITLGNVLAPALLEIVTPLGEWLEQTKNQDRVQKALIETMKDARAIFDGVRAVIQPLAEGVKTLADRMGGLDQAVRLLLTAMVVAKVVGFGTALTGLGTSAAGTTTQVQALRLALLRLSAIGVIVLSIEFLTNYDEISGQFQRLMGLVGLTSEDSEKSLERLKKKLEVIVQLFGQNSKEAKKLRDEITKIEIARIEQEQIANPPRSRGGSPRNRRQAATEAAEDAAAPIKASAEAKSDATAKAIAQGNRDNAALIAAEKRDQEALRNARRRAARISSQFKALGLTGEGEERVSSLGAIRRRGRSLIAELESSGLDASKIQSFVKRISVIFTKKFDDAGREIRQAILAMFGVINDALDQGGKQGPLTKTSGLNTKKILEGMGLSPEQIRELRGRLSSFNTAGRTPAGAQNLPTGGGFTGGTGFVVENFVTVAIDGQKFSAVVTKQQQKTKRRNPKQKRGPNRNR